MQLRGLTWWIDRWRKSSAFMHMTLEEQGAYRNLLDEAQLRGGALPTDERVLAKACGDALRWRFVRPAVMQHFEQRADGWHNDTLDVLLSQAVKRAAKQQAYRDRQRNANGNGHGNKPGNVTATFPGNRNRNRQYVQEPPIVPLSKGDKKPTRDELTRARDIRKNRMRCTHHPKCATHDACVRAIVAELRAKAGA